MKYLLLLVLFLVLYRFLNQIAKQIRNIATGFFNPENDGVQSESNQGSRTREIEDAEYEILSEESQEETD